MAGRQARGQHGTRRHVCVPAQSRSGLQSGRVGHGRGGRPAVAEGEGLGGTACPLPAGGLGLRSCLLDEDRPDRVLGKSDGMAPSPPSTQTPCPGGCVLHTAPLHTPGGSCSQPAPLSVGTAAAPALPGEGGQPLRGQSEAGLPAVLGDMRVVRPGLNRPMLSEHLLQGPPPCVLWGSRNRRGEVGPSPAGEQQSWACCPDPVLLRGAGDGPCFLSGAMVQGLL